MSRAHSNRATDTCLRRCHCCCRWRCRGATIAALVLVVLTGVFVAPAGRSATAASGQDERRPTTADLTRDAISPFLAVRERATDRLVGMGRDALALLTEWLGRGDWRLRAAAARGLGRLGLPEARDALVTRLDRERDPRIVDALADALVPYGMEAWTTLRTRVRSPRATALDRRAKSRFLWEYVISLVHRILSENTTAGGAFKGFYDGQFEAVAAIGPEAADVLMRMVSDAERFPVLVRQFAVRAMAEVGNRRHVARLRAFHQGLFDKYGPADTFSTRAPSDEQQLMIFARRVLARLGHRRPCLEEVERLSGQIHLWRGASGERAGAYQYELAYEWHQIRDYNRAMREYKRYLRDYPREVLDFSNSRHYAWYNMACICAKVNRKQEALTYLERAFLEDYTDFAWLELDRDLDNIRNLPAYRDLVQRYKSRLIPGEAPKK